MAKGCFTRIMNEAFECLVGRKTQIEIAREIGFPNANVVTILRKGLMRAPLARVPAIAKALEIDLDLAMRAWLIDNPDVAGAIETVYGAIPNRAERDMLADIRAGRVMVRAAPG